MSEFKLYRAKLKSRKQIMAEIPREQQGWWADVCAGGTLTLRDATATDLARCSINEGQSRDPADYLCEACERGSLVRRIAVKELTEIPDRRATPPSPSTAPSDRNNVLEEAAKLADAERAEFMQKAGDNNGRESDFAFGSVNSAERIAAAIRALKSESVAAPIAEGEREAFEAWARDTDQGYASLKGTGAPGAWYYFEDDAQATWAAWQARAALASWPAAEVEMPPLPEPIMGLWSENMKKAWSDQMRAYGQECARATLAANHFPKEST